MQAYRAVRQGRNLDQITQARHMQLYDSAKRDRTRSKTPDLIEFLPHPTEWQRSQQQSGLSISRRAAREVLLAIKKQELPAGLIAVVQKHLSEITAIAGS